LKPTDVCRAFAPGSIGNLACGFDVLGLALDGPGDTVLAHRAQDPGVRITSISGDGGRLPMEPGKNTAGAAARLNNLYFQSQLLTPRSDSAPVCEPKKPTISTPRWVTIHAFFGVGLSCGSRISGHIA